MSQIRGLIKAYRVNKLLDQLEFAKRNAVRAHYGLPPIVPWYEKCYTNCMDTIRTKFMEICCPCVLYFRDRKRRMKTCCGRCTLGGTYENNFFKSWVGFFAGLFTTLVLFFLLIWKFEFRFFTAMATCSLLGLVLSLGFAFNLTMRCYSLLIAPQFFSSRGRTFLLLYAFILVMGFPVKNVANNVVVLSEAATCGQALAYNHTMSQVQKMLSPMASMISNIREVLSALRSFSDKLRAIFLAFKTLIDEVADAVTAAINWVTSIVTKCNDTLGTPYNKCKEAFIKAKKDCDEALMFLDFLCVFVSLVSYVCDILKIAQLLCFVATYLKNVIKERIGEPIAKVLNKIFEMFYVSVVVDYNYELDSTQSRSYDDVKEAILAEIRAKVSTIDWLIDILNNLILLSILFVFIKAIFYREQFMTSESFDNRYVTKNLRAIDERRKKRGVETIFPLSGEENLKYVSAWTPNLTLHERRKMLRGIVLYFSSAIYAAFYLLCDIGLYWMLEMIRRHLDVKLHTQIPPTLRLHIGGHGLMADMFRVLVGTFDPLTGLNKDDLDSSMCVPKPSPPNYAVYKTIVSIYGVCLILTIFEAYALRIRHVVMGSYHPKRARTRATWLYNHIIKGRGGFLKLCRRQLRRKYRDDTSIKKASIRGKLVAQFPFLAGTMRIFGYDRKSCLLCGLEGRQNDVLNFFECSTADCDAVYCTDCFTDINNMCTVCMNPVEYGDNSDFSEERDSSEGEEEVQRKIELAQRRRQIREERIEARKPENLLQQFTGFADGSVKMARKESSSSSVLTDDSDTGSESAPLLSV